LNFSFGNVMLNFTKKRMNDHKEKILKICNETSKNTLMETLDIEYIDVGEDFLLARMPVTPKVHQPDGVLHGGATVALAESVGSAASYIFLDGNKFFIRGLEISANHVKSIKEGFVFARAVILHKGRTTQLWEIKITNEADQLISLCKLTTIALPRS
tara:strand:- start:6004 stop:6474 length:471 start_codon:yes stop_codon:yes gene_type:complete